jgi:Raf kinase inhibitor-like YbhB/YbcL family protein
METEKLTLKLSSPVFQHMGSIPARYTCEGENISPPLQIDDLPYETRSLALIVEDPDAPGGTFDHWIMWNIPAVNRIEENTAPGKERKNSKQEKSFTAPCPPTGTHHYHFRIFALDTELELPDNTHKKDLVKAMHGHIIAEGELIGLYQST